MLRNTKTRSLASILSVSGVDRNAYGLNPEKFADEIGCCPLCIAKLWKNGSYARYLPGESVHDGTPGVIYRKRCSGCKVSFSIHPEFLLVRRSYSLEIISAWLWAFLNGAPVRCREFLWRSGAVVPDLEQGLSWSDALDCQRTLPGHQRLHRWSESFCLKACKFLPELMGATIEAGVSRLAEGRKVVEAAQALETVWLHWEAMWQMETTTAGIDTEEAFRQLIRKLARNPLSHKPRRDNSRVYPYDVLIL